MGVRVNRDEVPYGRSGRGPASSSGQEAGFGIPGAVQAAHEDGIQGRVD